MLKEINKGNWSGEMIEVDFNITHDKDGDDIVNFELFDYNFKIVHESDVTGEYLDVFIIENNKKINILEGWKMTYDEPWTVRNCNKTIERYSHDDKTAVIQVLSNLF